VDDLKLAAGLFRVLLGNLDNLREEIVALGVGQSDVHAITGHQGDDALGDREGLAVRGAVGPAHDDLLALQVLEAAKVLSEVAQVSSRLGRVVLVALQVDDAGGLGEDALLLALLAGVRDLELVLVALAEEEVVADADDLSEEREHGGGLADGLAVGDLALALVHVEDVEAEEGAGGGEAAAGAGGLVAEDAHGTAALKDLAGDVLLVELMEGLGGVDKSIKLGFAVVPGTKKITAVHVDFGDKLLKLGKDGFKFS